MTHIRIALALIAIGSIPSVAAASCPAVIGMRLFSEGGGQTRVRLVTFESRSELSLYQIVQGNERLAWRAAVPYVPHDVWVDGSGRWVVTRGEHCEVPGEEHALVVYDARGELVRDWRLSELVSLERHSTILSNTPWSAAVELMFESREDTLTVVFPWGERRVLVPPVRSK